MTLDEIYNAYGRNWSNVCRELKLGKNTTSSWVKKGYIPMHTQLRIEKATNGKLLADVTLNKESQHVIK